MDQLVPKMDLDIEMGDAALEPIDVLDVPTADDILEPDDTVEPGELTDNDFDTLGSTTVVPEKLHLRGLDTLHTDDIKAYIKTYYGPVQRVEWIDDTSANLVFSSESMARDALTALSAIEVADASALSLGESLPAKAWMDRPDISLQLRLALNTDRKQAGAALRSRYYLTHPEHDPEEKRRRQQESRARYRDRDRRSRGFGRLSRRSDDNDVETFQATMYDEAPRTWAARSWSENRGKELFSRCVASQIRDRSASPRRQAQCDAHMDIESIGRESPVNRQHARSLKRHMAANLSNKPKELFPSKAPGRGGQLDQLERSVGSASLREEDMPKVVLTPAPAMFNIRGSASRGAEPQQHTAASGELYIKGTAKSVRELFPGKLGKAVARVAGAAELGAGRQGGGGRGNAGQELIDNMRSKTHEKAQYVFS